MDVCINTQDLPVLKDPSQLTLPLKLENGKIHHPAHIDELSSLGRSHWRPELCKPSPQSFPHRKRNNQRADPQNTTPQPTYHDTMQSSGSSETHREPGKLTCSLPSCSGTLDSFDRKGRFALMARGAASKSCSTLNWGVY